MNSIMRQWQRKKMRKVDERELGEDKKRGREISSWMACINAGFFFFLMNEFCSIIDRGLPLFQSLRHLLFISQYLCSQIGLSYGGLKQQCYRWQEISREIDNDGERCHIKSEGATVNIPAQRRIFLASTLLQRLFFFFRLQLKFTPPSPEVYIPTPFTPTLLYCQCVHWLSP